MFGLTQHNSYFYAELVSQDKTFIMWCTKYVNSRNMYRVKTQVHKNENPPSGKFQPWFVEVECISCLKSLPNELNGP